MRTRSMRLVATLLVFAWASGCRGTHDTAADRAAIEQVFNTYLQSLDRADLGLAARVWLQSPDVLVVTPFGRVNGWDSVRNDIYINSMQKQMRSRHAEASNLALVVSGDAAWLVYDFAFTATLADGRSFKSKGWESHGYRRTSEGWRIVALHYSVPATPQ